MPLTDTETDRERVTLTVLHGDAEEELDSEGETLAEKELEGELLDD